MADHVSSEKFADATRVFPGDHHIIGLLYTPDGALRGRCDEAVSQIDLMPTLLGLMGNREPYFAFGRDLFGEQTPEGASPSLTTADSRPSAATACSSSTSGARPAPTARTTCAANTIWETIPKRQRWKDASKPSSSNITVTSNKKISPSNNPMEFRPVRLEDKAAIERFTRPSGICNCDLAFANMYCWEGTYRSAWCVEEGFLLIRFYIDGSHHIGYMQPLGEGDFTHLIPRLEADARAAGQPLRISGLTPEGAAAVRRAHPEFGIWRNRDYEDYVYRADDLRNLTGRRYQPKRNHINRFEAAYDYRYEELTPALAPNACASNANGAPATTAMRPS